MSQSRLLPLVLAGALALAGCAPGSTVTTGVSKIAKPGAQTAAKASASKALNMVSKIGAAGLKVRNNLKKQPAIADPRLARKTPLSKYRILDVDSVSYDAKGDATVNTPDGQLEASVGVAATASIAANDGVASDVVVEATESVAVDQVGGDTGTEAVNDVEGADGTIKGGEIVYSPDASASADGQVSEDITFNALGNDQASVSVSLGADPADGLDQPTQASVTEDEQANGDIDVEGDIVLPTGDKVHLVIAYHPDGTKDITCVGSGYSFAVKAITPDGVGTGTLYDRDPGDPNAVKIGVITLNKGSQPDTVAFYGSDGNLGETQTFKFLNS